MGDITQNFSYKEFLVSSRFPELNKIDLDTSDMTKIFYLCKIVLQPLRDYAGLIHVTSGKRSLSLNKAVGGSRTSDHLYLNNSCAVDFTCNKVRDAYEYLSSRDWVVGQLIYYPDKNFIHVSLPSYEHHGEILTM